MSGLGDKRIRLTYDDGPGMGSEVAAIRAATEENARRLHDVRKRFDRKLAAVRDEFSAIHHGLQLEKAGEASQSLARTWTKKAVALRDEIAASDDHERFAAGELAVVVRRLAGFADDSDGHTPQARYLMAWTAARDLAELRSRIAERAQEWETLRTACVDGLTALRDRWQELATQELAGEDETVTVDVDHWSNHAHAVLGKQLTSALNAVADPATAPDTATLTTLLNGELDRYTILLDQVLRDALAAHRHARVRAEVFTGVAKQVAARGWQIVESRTGFDEAGDLVATMVNSSGAKLRVRLPAPGANVLSVHIERIGGEPLPNGLGTLLRSAVEEVVRGWATVEEVPAADDGDAWREHG
jgi:hypothetical protein